MPFLGAPVVNVIGNDLWLAFSDLWLAFDGFFFGFGHDVTPNGQGFVENGAARRLMGEIDSPRISDLHP